VVPKHRRSEFEPSLMPASGPVTTADFWPEPGGYGQLAGGDPGWVAAPEAQSVEEWQDWQDWEPHDWGPPPPLHPDHPSAPVPRVQFPADYPPAPAPRVQFPADHPSRPLPAVRAPSGPDLPQRRPGGLPTTWNAPAAGYNSPRDTGAFRAARGPGYGLSQNGHPPAGDVLWTAGQVLTQADRQAAQIAQEAHDYAASVLEAAEREADTMTRSAAAVRAAAEREAAERHAHLDSMTGELGRVAAYISESLAAFAPPGAAQALAPAPPAVRSALPAARSAPPDTLPPRPATRPARPDNTPNNRPAARPPGATRPGRTPARQPQKPLRQRHAIRFATWATATLVLFAVICGATEVGLHGFKFFVFRGGGVGETGGTETDQQFLARQAAAHHVVAPKAPHDRKSHKTDR